MNQILTLVIGFISLLSEKQDMTAYIKESFENAKAIYDKEPITYVYYRIADGIGNTLVKNTTGIEHLLPQVNYIKS